MAIAACRLQTITHVKSLNTSRPTVAIFHRWRD